MRRTRVVPASLAFVLLLGLRPGAQAQDPTPPSPEQERLQAFVGSWKTKSEFFLPGAKAPIVSTGVETARLVCEGRWLASDFRSDDPKAPFSGHGVLGWDSAKGKYVSTWVDSLSPSVQLAEGSVDASGRIFTLEGLVPDGLGGPLVRQRTVSEIKDARTRSFSMYRPLPDGKDHLLMRITYERR